VHRKRRPAVVTPAPPVVLMMIAATDVSGGPDDLWFTAVFNTSAAAPLASVEAADASKWNARFDGQRFEGTLLTRMSDSTIFVEMVVVGPDSGANEVNYTNAPSDIADVLGRHLAAFAGFPL
jgi:hypothetical protein